MSDRSNNSLDEKGLQENGSRKKSVQKKRDAAVEKKSAPVRKESLEERMARKMAAMDADKKPATKESLEERMGRKMAAMNEKRPSDSSGKESMEERMARKMAAVEGKTTSSRKETKEERLARKMAAYAETPGDRKERKEERLTRKMAEYAEAHKDRKETKEERFARKMAEDAEARGDRKETKEEILERKMAEYDEARGDGKETKEERLARKMAENARTHGARKETTEERFARKMAARKMAAMKSTLKTSESQGQHSPSANMNSSNAGMEEGIESNIAQFAAGASAGTMAAAPNAESDNENSSQAFLASDLPAPIEPDMTRLPSRTTRSREKTNRGSSAEDAEYVPGAYHVDERAIGALPAWAPSRRRSSAGGNENVNEDADADLPPEMRVPMPDRISQRLNGDEDEDSNEDLPPALRAVASSRSVQDALLPDQELPAEVAAVTLAEQAPKPRDSNRRFWIITGIAVAAAVAIAVATGIALSFGGNGGGDSSGEALDQCDFPGIEQPDAFMQCQCNQEIAEWSEDGRLRYQDLLSTVIPLVNPDFAEPETSCAPSNLALAWLATDEYSSATTDMVTLTNRYVLALLFHTWTGTSWKTSDGWLSSLSECRWYGITCDGTAITGIELGGNSLQSGPEDGLPTEMFILTSLKTFNASEASLNGSIPSEIRSLVNLERLDLGSFHSFLGQYPNELFALPKLRMLDLSYPTDGGNIPTLIGLQTQLESFKGNNAGLVGTIPSEIGLMTSLVTLSMDTNYLSGTFPVEIGMVRNLGMLILSQNKIEGTIPADLGALSSLVILNLGVNALRGSIPIEVASLPNLQLVRLRENRLTGTVPEEILASGKLICFDASQNQMDSYVPQGDCPLDTPAGSLSTVCHEVNDPACSCCTCLPEGSMDYCNIRLL